MNLICYMASLIVAFFTRKVFLDQLGTEFIGLTGTLQSLLGFLNLAELGVGTAIGYVLYKPIFDDNKEKINEIISVFGYLYRCIGLVILGAGIILSLFLPLIFPNTTFSWGVIYFGFYAFLASSMLGYFVNYRQTLLSADQRNYEVTGYYQIINLSKVIIQAIIALRYQNFILFLSLEIIFGAIYSFILSYRINKVYPWLESDIKLGKKLFRKYPEIGTYIKQLFIHKIAGFVQYQITPFLVYAYVSLPIVALYGNYTLITQKVQGFISSILDSTSAGIGSLISEGNKEKIYKTYKELFAIRFVIANILTMCIYTLCNPFISLWLGDEYPLSSIIVSLISIHFFLLVLRGINDQFIFGFGLFYDTWAPMTESVIFIVSAMICGSLWGLPGVLCGPLISTILIIYIWKPYFLFSKGFKRSFREYLNLFVLHLIPIIIADIIVFIVVSKFIRTIDINDNWTSWILFSLQYTTLSIFFSIMALLPFSSGLRNFINRLVKRKFSNK